MYSDCEVYGLQKHGLTRSDYRYISGQSSNLRILLSMSNKVISVTHGSTKLYKVNVGDHMLLNQIVG